MKECICIYHPEKDIVQAIQRDYSCPMHGGYCCNGTNGCLGKGEKHWCQENIKDHTLTKIITVVKPELSGAILSQRKFEALELILVCAKDIIEAWPKVSFRTIYTMTQRIDTLRQAVQAFEKE